MGSCPVFEGSIPSFTKIIMVNFFIISLNYGILIGSVLLCISSINPIHSLLSLINVFFAGSIFLVILKLVFFALIFLAVYLGAIAVLFLFIVMMLDIKLINETKNLIQSLSFFDIFIFFIFFILYNVNKQDIIGLSLIKKLIYDISNYLNENENMQLFTFDVDYFDFHNLIDIHSQLEEIGIHMLEENSYSLLNCGLFLFIAMIGAIILTVEPSNKKYLYQQEAGLQSARKSNIILLKKYI